MALQPRIPVAVANNMLDAGIGTLANSAKLRIYDGTQPAAGGGSLSSNNLLAELTMNADAFPSAANNQLTAGAITQASSANNTGTATWFRLLDNGGTNTLLDGSVGTATADLILNSTSIVAGGVVQVSSFVITMPLL